MCSSTPRALTTVSEHTYQRSVHSPFSMRNLHGVPFIAILSAMPKKSWRVTEAKETILTTASKLFGGTWGVIVWDKDTITVRRINRGDTEQEMSRIFSESLSFCRMRAALKTSMVRVRDNLDRQVRYDCVHKVWNWLARTIPTESRLIAGCPVAWTSPILTLRLQLQALHNTQALGTMDTYRKGELWVRLGIDGVPLWKSHVVATTLSMCGDLHGYPEHSPKRHCVIGLFRGYDTIDGLHSVLEGIKLDTDLSKLDKQHINLPNGQTLRVRVFPTGDHMLQYKVCGRDGPTGTKPERHPCPCCDAPAREVATYAAAPRPYAKASSALFQSIPVEQHATDVAHGVVNVTYTVELPLVENFLVDECGLSRTQWLAMYANVAADSGVPSTADDELRNISSQTDYLERSISHAVSFFWDAAF